MGDNSPADALPSGSRPTARSDGVRQDRLRPRTIGRTACCGCRWICENTRRKEQRIVYRFVWLDAKGIEVSSVQNDWLPKIVGGYETIQLVGIAPDPRVTDGIVKIKESLRN